MGILECLPDAEGNMAVTCAPAESPAGEFTHYDCGDNVLLPLLDDCGVYESRLLAALC